MSRPGKIPTDTKRISEQRHCPMCNHTMQNLSLHVERKFWCPRCGTVKAVGADGFEFVQVVQVPRWTRLLAEARQEELYRELLAVEWPRNAARKAKGG